MLTQAVVPVALDVTRARVYVAAAIAITLALMTARAAHDLRPGVRLMPGTPALLGASARSAMVRDTLQPQATDVWVFRFSGLVPARLHVETPRPADVSCRLFDPEGQPVPRVAGPASCRLAWIPARTGAYRVEITNRRHWEVPYTVSAR